MLTIEECMDLGVLITEEQLDFLRHPEGRLAVAVYGVPDPDRLYIAGPDREATIYQVAPPGEPADENGLSACILPIVMQGGNQDDLQRIFDDYVGDEGEDFPVVYGNPCDAEFMYAWTSDEVPIYQAPWDLWPITADEVHTWAGAAEKAFWSSALMPMFEYIESFNGSEYYGEIVEDLRNQYYEVTREMHSLERDQDDSLEQDQELVQLAEKANELREAIERESALYMERLESQILHPVTGDPDAQMPPVKLPSEQAAIWRSLQSLSWRNWSTLNKALGDGDDALYGGRFVQANRRLCPWY